MGKDLSSHEPRVFALDEIAGLVGQAQVIGLGRAPVLYRPDVVVAPGVGRDVPVAANVATPAARPADRDLYLVRYSAPKHVAVRS